MLIIKEVLKEKGLTQIDLSKKMGVSRSAVVKMLSGNPTIGTLQKIADVLEVDLLDLFKDNRPKESPVLICPHCQKPITVELK